MGSWGISAHESDDGHDLLAVAKDRYLRGVNFKTFHVKHITELLRSHIIDEFVKESNGWESHYIDFFYDCTFPCRFAHAVMLVAECFAEYRENGKYMTFDYATEKTKKRRIADFIYTSKDLETLRIELQSILNPRHGLYESWKDSESFNEWQAHIQTLCDILSQAIRGNMMYVRKIDGEIVNRAKIHRMPSGRYAIKTNVFDGQFEVNMNLPLFDTEAQAQEWLETSEVWETYEGGDSHA